MSILYGSKLVKMFQQSKHWKNDGNFYQLGTLGEDSLSLDYLKPKILKYLNSSMKYILPQKPFI